MMRGLFSRLIVTAALIGIFSLTARAQSQQELANAAHNLTNLSSIFHAAHADTRGRLEASPLRQALGLIVETPAEGTMKNLVDLGITDAGMAVGLEIPGAGVVSGALKFLFNEADPPDSQPAPPSLEFAVYLNQLDAKLTIISEKLDEVRKDLTGNWNKQFTNPVSKQKVTMSKFGQDGLIPDYNSPDGDRIRHAFVKHLVKATWKHYTRQNFGIVYFGNLTHDPTGNKYPYPVCYIDNLPANETDQPSKANKLMNKVFVEDYLQGLTSKLSPFYIHAARHPQNGIQEVSVNLTAGSTGGGVSWAYYYLSLESKNPQNIGAGKIWAKYLLAHNWDGFDGFDEDHRTNVFLSWELQGIDGINRVMFSDSSCTPWGKGMTDQQKRQSICVAALEKFVPGGWCPSSFQQ